MRMLLPKAQLRQLPLFTQKGLTMNTNLEIIEAALEKLANGDSQPTFTSTEFASLLAAITSVSADDHRRIGAKTLVVLLNRLQAGMTAERTLKIMRSGDNPMRLS